MRVSSTLGKTITNPTPPLLPPEMLTFVEVPNTPRPLLKPPVLPVPQSVPLLDTNADGGKTPLPILGPSTNKSTGWNVDVPFGQASTNLGQAGVYAVAVLSLIEWLFYIGSSYSMFKRTKQHLENSERGKGSKKVRKFLRAHGGSAQHRFILMGLHEVDPAILAALSVNGRLSLAAVTLLLRCMEAHAFRPVFDHPNCANLSKLVFGMDHSFGKFGGEGGDGVSSFARCVQCVYAPPPLPLYRRR